MTMHDHRDHDHVHEVDTAPERTAAAGMNLLAVLVVLAVLAALLWFLFTGPLAGTDTTPTTDDGTTINPPAQVQPGTGTDDEVLPTLAPGIVDGGADGGGTTP